MRYYIIIYIILYSNAGYKISTDCRSSVWLCISERWVSFWVHEMRRWQSNSPLYPFEVGVWWWQRLWK